MLKPRTITIISVVGVFWVIGLLPPDSETTPPTASPTITSTQTATPTAEPDSSSDKDAEVSPETTPEPSGDNEASAPESTMPANEASDEPTTEPAPEQSPEPTQAPETEQPQQEPESELVAEPTPDQTETNIYSTLLAGLTLAPEVTSGYDRDLFKHWVDADRDGCNAREEVLIIESLDPVELSSTCRALSGRWLSRFDGVVITESSRLDIDHMVPLKEAWDSGANAWSAERREAFANDLDLPEALIAVSASSNRSKSARDPAEWLPTAGSYVCQYVKDWMSVKTKWQLSVDQREFEALRSVSLGCVN